MSRRTKHVKKQEPASDMLSWSESEDTDSYMNNDELIEFVTRLKECGRNDKYRIAQLEEKVKQNEILKLRTKELLENQSKKIIMLENNAGKIKLGKYKKEIGTITMGVTNEIREELRRREEELMEKEFAELERISNGRIQEVELVKRKK